MYYVAARGTIWTAGEADAPVLSEIATDSSMPAVGIDWYRRGWVAVALGGAPVIAVDVSLSALVDRFPDAAAIGVDMPIGLPEARRAADELARAYVGRRRSSVFMTPPHRVLQAATYAEANAIAPALTGGKISQQAWALRHGIEAVATVAAGDARVIEVHPEVSFRAMTGAELPYAKSTWNGQALRRAALARAGIVLPDQLDAAGHVPVADVLDAAAVAWSAARYARGEARSLPPDAARGQREVIWY